MILKFVQIWVNKRTRDIMQGANADDCIPSWRIMLCLVHSWKVRIAADPHANSPSQTEWRRPCLAPNPHDALCRFCSPSRTLVRIRIAVWQEEIRLHQFRDRGIFVVTCNSLQTGHGRPECVDAIVHGRKIGIGGDGIFHKLLSQGVVGPTPPQERSAEADAWQVARLKHNTHEILH